MHYCVTFRAPNACKAKPFRITYYSRMRGINDKLKDFIIWAIECYEVAAQPPAMNYSRRVDPTFRDDVNGYSRAYLLRLGIDAKYALNDTLNSIPIKRANVLMGWITSAEDYYWHNLTHKQQVFLKIDRNKLRERIWKN